MADFVSFSAGKYLPKAYGFSPIFKTDLDSISDFSSKVLKCYPTLTVAVH